MIGTIVFVVMFVAMVMASAGIYQLIKHLKMRAANDTSEQKQQLRNAFEGRVIKFYVPDNFSANRQGDARVRSQLAARQREQRG